MSEQIKVVKNFVGAEDSKLIYEYAKDHDSMFVDFGNGEKEFTFHADFTKGSIREKIDLYGKKVMDFVVENYPGPFKDYDNTTTHIARFSEGWGMHEHFDSTKPQDIATLIYINDNYSGGEIYFPDYDISIKPESGDLVCFPDTPDFVHGVKPVVHGIRYTIPRWFTRIV
jgi:hypothetical protein